MDKEKKLNKIKPREISHLCLGSGVIMLRSLPPSLSTSKLTDTVKNASNQLNLIYNTKTISVAVNSTFVWPVREQMT